MSLDDMSTTLRTWSRIALSCTKTALYRVKDAQIAARNGTPLTGRPAASQRTALDRFWDNGFAAYRIDSLDVAGEPHGLRPWCRIPKLVASRLPVWA